MFDKKVLVIGNETADTDAKVCNMAIDAGTANHGLLTNLVGNLEIGFYHTSVTDMLPGIIVSLADQFDLIYMLDQPKESYPHFKTFVTTVRLMYDLENKGIKVEFRNNKSTKNFIKWRNFLNENKSFCFYPFAALIDNIGTTCICPKSREPITKSDSIVDWQTDPYYVTIRDKMIAGEMMVERCNDCYEREIEGQESTRQFETLEWTERLSLESVEDFQKIKTPLFYEIRPSNLCNIMCRTCDDGHSHLLEKEFRNIGIPLVDWKFQPTNYDKIDFNVVEKIYWGGGEPVIMPEFYTFLEKCLENNNTDFELYIGTNGMKFSNKIVDLLDNFSDVTFSFSYDGYQKVNDYIRWKSKFDVVVENGRKMRERGHKIGLQTVFSMWSLTRIHEVFEFYDREYPGSGLLVQVAGTYSNDRILLPYNHPCPDMVLESLRKCQKTKTYYTNGRSVKSMIDLLIDHYSDLNYKVDDNLLRKFYEFNDKLDTARNSRLEDYIPELAAARKLYDI